MKFNYLLVVIAILCLSSCRSDDLCNMTTVGPDLFLDDESESYIMNYLDRDSIFFLDQNMDTVIFEIVHAANSLVEYTSQITCASDENVLIDETANFQQLYATLYSADFDLFLYYRLSRYPSSELKRDVLDVSSGSDKFYTDNAKLLSYYYTHDYYEEESNDFVVEHDSISYNGRVFYDVIETTKLLDETVPRTIVSYTKEQGIVSLKNSILGIEMTYLKSE